MKHQFFVALVRGVLVFFLFLAVVFILVSLGIANASHIRLTELLLWAGVLWKRCLPGQVLYVLE